MPRPPNLGVFSELNFITNVALVGCDPPLGLLVEFAKDPLKDLALLIFVPDAFDVAQAIFEPRSHRKTRPNRRGRKRGRGRGLPDTSEIIGDKIRGYANPYDAINVGPARWFFRLLNIYEGVAFTAAIVEGLTDVGFESLLGVFRVDPNICSHLIRISQSMPDGGSDTVGTGPNIIGIPIVDFNNGFIPGISGTTLSGRTYEIAISMTGTGVGFYPDISGTVKIKRTSGELLAESYPVNLGLGDSTFISVAATVEGGGSVTWFWDGDSGQCKMTNGLMLAYEKSPLLWT